jgi:hypothetical protein
MDPNKALERMRKVAGWAETAPTALSTHPLTVEALQELAELFRGLDEWLTRGGFPPEAWREGPDACGEESPASSEDEGDWLYDSAHLSAAEQAARLAQLSEARPDAEVGGRRVAAGRGALFEVWIRPREDEAPTRVSDIPADWPVQPVRPVPGDREIVTCGHCGLSWDDALVTSMTPAPAARCPFERFHV